MSIKRPRNNKQRKRKQYTSGESRKKSRWKQGFYQPINEDKYKQPVDTTMNSKGLPEYRSSWELKFMEYLDKSDNILYWGTEAFSIKYISPKDNRQHRYYIDFVFMTKNNEKHLIEIKPKAQCNDPVNLAKWEAAEQYCKVIGATFSVVTEIELKKWGLLI